VDPNAYADILTAASRKAALQGQASGLSASKMNNANAALCSDNTTNTNSCPTGLTQDQLTNFNSLSFQMTQLLQSEVACPGDGNEDKVVNGQDLAFWRKFAELAMGGSSWYDFNLDGMTDPADLVIIKKNLGTKCLPKK